MPSQTPPQTEVKTKTYMQEHGSSAIQVLLDSNTDSVGGNRAHLLYRFPTTLQLDPKKVHAVRISKGRIPVTVANISAAKGNNTFTYQLDAASGYTTAGTTQTITLPDGVYSPSGMIAAWKYYLKSNGDYTAGPNTPYDDTYPLTLGFNDSTGKSYVISDDVGHYIDFTADASDPPAGAGSSTHYQVLGFYTGTVTSPTPTAPLNSALEYVSTNDVDIYGADGSFRVTCNLTKTFNSRHIDTVIYSGSWESNPYSAQVIPSTTSEALNKIPLTQGYQTEIDEIEVRLINSQGNLLTFTGQAIDANVEIELVIEPLIGGSVQKF
jgi:hypothetical protein